jgi:hypothetical protein
MHPAHSDDERDRLARKREDSLTLASGGVLCLVIATALVFLIGGGLASWVAAILGAGMLVKGLVDFSIARRALG